MELVGTLFRYRIHDAAGRAVFGIGLGDEQLEFLDRFNRNPRLIAAAGAVVVAAAIEGVVHRATGLAADGTVHDAWQDRQIRREIPVAGRQVDQFAGRHEAAHLFGRGIDERRLRADGDLLAQAADSQRDIDRYRLPDLEPEVGALIFVEARQLGLDVIHPRHQTRKLERAVAGARGLTKDARVLVTGHHQDPRQDAALLVDHLAREIGGAALGR